MGYKRNTKSYNKRGVEDLEKEKRNVEKMSGKRNRKEEINLREIV